MRLVRLLDRPRWEDPAKPGETPLEDAAKRGETRLRHPAKPGKTRLATSSRSSAEPALTAH